MDVELALTPLCSKCDRHAVAMNGKMQPLCSRHAMIFLTAPRMLAQREAEFVPDEDPDDWDAHDGPDGTPGADSMRATRRVPENGSAPDASDSLRRVLRRVMERLDRIEAALDLDSDEEPHKPWVPPHLRTRPNRRAAGSSPDQ